jgi:hypothetical protein
MSVPKVEKQRIQVKLVFGNMEAGQFPLDPLMEEVHLEFHAFATSPGVLVMKALMEAEEKHLAGEHQSHETEVNRRVRSSRNPFCECSLVGQGKTVSFLRDQTPFGQEYPCPSLTTAKRLFPTFAAGASKPRSTDEPSRSLPRMVFCIGTTPTKTVVCEKKALMAATGPTTQNIPVTSDNSLHGSAHDSLATPCCKACRRTWAPCCLT